jgi:hypothetical protein
VSVFYVYIFDEQMGPGFIKICTYFPYPVKVYLLWRLPHKSHYAAARIMSGAAGWPMRDRWSGRSVR